MEELNGRSIKDLKAMAIEKNVDLRGCTEKADIIERLLNSLSVTEAFKEPPLKMCLACGIVKSSMNKCAVCKDKYRLKSYYCSKKCQTEDWPRHQQLHKSQQSGSVPVKNVDESDVKLHDAENRITTLMAKACDGDSDAVEKQMGAMDQKDLLATLCAADIQGMTLLSYASYLGNVRIVKLLLSLRDTSLLDNREGCPSCLTLACQMGHTQVVELLLKAGGDALAQKTSISGHTCLHIAAMEGHLAVVETLLAQCPRLLHITNSSGETCLHLAAYAGHLDVVRALVGAGDDALLHAALTGKVKGATCLYLASQVRAGRPAPSHRAG